jgi:hypothetical protein
MRSLWVALLVALATPTASARHHHHTVKRSTVPTTAPAANIPTEKDRDPADVALDRKIKSICRGC